MVDTDDNTREFIIDRYEKAIKNSDSSLEVAKDELIEEVYLELRKENTSWTDIKEMAQQHEKKHGLVLNNVKEFVSKLDDNDFVKSKSDGEVEQSLSEGKKQALMTQIRAQPGKHNLIYTDETIGNNDRKILTEEIYTQHKKCAFIISKQDSWKGRISLELSRTKERYNLTDVFAGKQDGLRFHHFGESKSQSKGLAKIDSHTQSFYQYKFIADDKEYILLSDEKLEPMRCTITGTKVNIGDYKSVGENRKLPVDQEIIFVHSSEPAIEPMPQAELDEFRQGIDEEWLANKVFGEFRHPDWYETMIESILFVKDDNGYPSHLMQMAEAGTGKSAQLEALTEATDEGKPPFTGTSSTIKGLVPSFKESPPDEGFLMRCDRVAAVDEKFNLLSNTVQNSNSRMQDAFRPMLDLLEHSSREFSSGNGSITGKTEATMFAMGNPAYGINSIYEALENQKIDEAYLSRFILYDQLDSHIDYIQSRKHKTAKGSDEQYLPDTDDEFVSLLDTMRMRHVDGIDHKRVGEMHEELQELVPSVFNTTFRARYKHHVINLVAGNAKIRYLVDNRDELVAKDEDYEKAKEIMEIVISSWGNVNMKNLSYSARINSLPDEARRFFEAVNQEPGIAGKELMSRVDSKKAAKSMNKIRDLGLAAVVEKNGVKCYYPYWSEEYKEAVQG